MLEMKTVISTMLRHFRVLPVSGKTTFEPLFRITLRARGGLWIRLEPKNNNNEQSKNFNDVETSEIVE
jgi:cytochrome P450